MSIKCILQGREQDLSNKQTKLIGTSDQIVGFNEAGEATPQVIGNFINEITSQDVINIWNTVNPVLKS